MKVRKSKPLFLLALALLLSSACNSDPVDLDEKLPDAEMRVLFIGNSLTYTNDLPGIVQTVAGKLW